MMMEARIDGRVLAVAGVNCRPVIRTNHRQMELGADPEPHGVAIADFTYYPMFLELPCR